MATPQGENSIQLTTAVPSEALQKLPATMATPQEEDLGQPPTAVLGNIPPATLAPTTAAQSDDSLLLSLPIELLQRITNLLDAQKALPNVRLACKTLELASFERFALAAITEHHHCVYYEPSLLRLEALLNSNSPSRLALRITKVRFTTTFLESRDIDEIQLAPAKDLPMKEAQIKAYKAYRASAAFDNGINFPLMARILSNLRSRSPRIMVGLFMVSNHDQRLAVGYDVLMAAAAADSAFQQLMLPFPCVLGSGDPNCPQLNLIKCTSSLKAFGLPGEPGLEDSADIRKTPLPTILQRLKGVDSILRSAKQLRWLTLDLFILLQHKEVSHVAAGLLNAVEPCNISRLTLQNMVVKEDDISKALARWRPGLKWLEMAAVKLTNVRKQWPGILQLIASMLKLESLQLFDLEDQAVSWTHKQSVVSFAHLEVGLKTARELGSSRSPPAFVLMYTGRDQVVAGMEALLASPLSYHGY